MKRKKKITAFFESNRTAVWIAIVLLVFPIIVGLIYALPLPQVIAVSSEDMLSFYGTAFGIFGSFILYRLEKKNEEKKRNKELKPIFSVEVELSDKEKGLFKININNLTQNKLTYLYLYDEFVSPQVEKHYSFQITFNKSKSEAKQLNPNFNITMDSDIIDKDGLPKYVQLLCDDIDGNMWNYCLVKVNNFGTIFYYPNEVEIV